MNKYLLLLLVALFSGIAAYAQSDLCATATVLTLNTSGNACFNGTNATATSSLTTNNCTPNPVNEVWFTYVVGGSSNTFTVTPGTLQNAVVSVYSGGCGPGNYEFCSSATGTNNVNFSYGLPTGTQVWISVASNSMTNGTFQFCVTSVAPSPNPPGNTSCTAIAVCAKNNNINFTDMSIYSASGTKASCFTGPGANPTQEVWISFCVSQSGTITWTGDPSNNTTEFDWSMWDITDDCPGTQVACNYAWNSQTGVNFGMGCTTTDCNPAFNAVAGRCYAIQIVNWSNNGAGFAFLGIGGTALISPGVNFNMTQTAQCNIPVTASFTTGSGHAGVIDWDFGNGNTWSGTGAPSPQTYNEPGTYAVVASAGTGTCYVQQIRYVNVFAPLQATHTFVNDFCNNTNGGSISVTPSGGNGVYTYSWSPAVSTGPTASNLAPGTYTVTITNAACSQNISIPVTLTGYLCCGVDIAFGPTRLCMSNSPITLGATITGATNYTASWSPTTYLTNPNTLNATFTPPSAGFYTLTLEIDNTSEGGCVTPRTVTYQVIDVVPVGQATATTCPGTCDGSVSITGATGGNEPYTYTWSNGLSPGATKTGVCAGSYTATVTEAGGCRGYLPLVVTETSPFTVGAGADECITSGCVNLTGTSSIPLAYTCNNTTHSWTGTKEITNASGSGPSTVKTNTTQDLTVAGTQAGDLLSSVCFTINHTKHSDIENIFVRSPDGTIVFYFLDATYSMVEFNGSRTYCFDISKFSTYTGPLNGTWTLNVRDGRNSGGGTGNITNFTIITCRPVYPDLWSPISTITGDPKSLLTTACPTATTTYTLTVRDANGCTIQDQVTITVGTCSALHVDLGSFTAENISGTSHLNWTTLSESNSDYFLIERSFNAEDYSYLTQTSASGYSSSLKDYSVYDYNPHKGINYYRLSEIDYNGNQTIKGVVVVNIKGVDRELKIVPNPADKYIEVQYSASSFTNNRIRIMDLSGRIVFEMELKNSESEKFIIDIKNLENGIYFISLQNDFELKSTRLIKH
jgi:hypothetical protein